MTRPSPMSFSHVIDSYAWIEYFRASREGEKARQYIEGEGAATPIIVVAEVSRKLLREVEAGQETSEQRQRHMEFIRSASQIVGLDFDQAVDAGRLDLEMKKKIKGWGLADTFVLALARSAGAKVVTGDEHFRETRDAIMIKETRPK